MNFKIYITVFFASVILSCGNVNDVLRGVEQVLNEGGTTSTIPTNAEIGQGLKAALTKGTNLGVVNLAQKGGYLNQPKFKIPFPPDAVKIENTLRQAGLGSEVDKVVVSLNRAAEDAVVAAKPLFVNAIKQMTLNDVKNILFGNDHAATDYFRSKMTSQLTKSFQPKIKNSLDKVNATKYWKDVIGTYNRIPLVTKMNPDLDLFVTEKAIDGLFLKIEEEEKEIRENPIARTTSILQKVFGYAESSSN